MDVRIVHTGSKGNCAVVDNAIIIDAGWNELVNGVALFLTHSHGDHVKHLDKMFGIPIHALPETIETLQKDARFDYTAFTPITAGIPVLVNTDEATYYVTPIPVKHDVQCVSFDIKKVCKQTMDETRLFFGTDFNSIIDETLFVKNLRDKVYDSIYIEANNTLVDTDFLDVYFPEEGMKEPRDAFHRTRSFRNHTNVSYLTQLFEKAGYNETNRFTEPIWLLHKSSRYYAHNPERVVNLCKIANIKNPIN